jgi:hypothetical protein
LLRYGYAKRASWDVFDETVKKSNAAIGKENSLSLGNFKAVLLGRYEFG